MFKFRFGYIYFITKICIHRMIEWNQIGILQNSPAPLLNLSLLPFLPHNFNFIFIYFFTITKFLCFALTFTHTRISINGKKYIKSIENGKKTGTKVGYSKLSFHTSRDLLCSKLCIYCVRTVFL